MRLLFSNGNFLIVGDNSESDVAGVVYSNEVFEYEKIEDFQSLVDLYAATYDFFSTAVLASAKEVYDQHYAECTGVEDIHIDWLDNWAHYNLPYRLKQADGYIVIDYCLPRSGTTWQASYPLFDKDGKPFPETYKIVSCLMRPYYCNFSNRTGLGSYVVMPWGMYIDGEPQLDEEALQDNYDDFIFRKYGSLNAGAEPTSAKVRKEDLVGYVVMVLGPRAFDLYTKLTNREE